MLQNRLRPEQAKQRAEAKRAEEAAKEKRNADFDLTSNDETGQAEVSEGNPDGTSLVNRPVRRVASESDVHQMKTFNLKKS